ncbi:25793_t:CDS:1, partial [Dentiscutata erythropus]
LFKNQKMFEQTVIDLLAENSFSVNYVKKDKYKYPFLKVSFEQYYYHLIIWDKDTITIKNILDIEKERSKLYKFENVNRKNSAILVYKSSLGDKVSNQFKKMDNIRYTNQPNLANPDFLTENEKNIINYLYNTIYLNYLNLTGIPDMNNFDFIQFMKTKVKNPEDIEKNLLEFVSTKKIPLTKQNKHLSKSIKNILMKKPMLGYRVIDRDGKCILLRK